jgi:hypothetical protein
MVSMGAATQPNPLGAGSGAPGGSDNLMSVKRRSTDQRAFGQ